MKNYFNEKEREAHLGLCAMQAVLEQMKDSDSLSAQESNALNIAYENMVKFNAMIFERFGEAYRAKLSRFLQLNEVCIVSKYGNKDRNSIVDIPIDDIKSTITDIQFMHCIDCGKQDYAKCPVYNMSVACDMEGKCNDGCPFTEKFL